MTVISGNHGCIDCISTSTMHIEVTYSETCHWDYYVI